MHKIWNRLLTNLYRISKGVNDMRHISKMCYKRCDGWMVRVSRDCVTYNKYFGSNSYGSTENAFDAAKNYLEKLKSNSPHLFVHSLYKKKNCKVITKLDILEYLKLSKRVECIV